MKLQHTVYLGEGAQTIRTVPINEARRPVVVASGTYEIRDLRYGDDNASAVLASGNVAVDSVSTTLSAAAGPRTADARSLTVASAVGIVAGRQYLLRQGGRTELVTVDGIDGTTLRLRSKVGQEFPATTTALVGIEVSFEVPADVTADEDKVYRTPGNLAVRLELAGTPPRIDPIFLERASVAPVVTRADVLAMDATLGNYDEGGLGLDLAIMQAISDLTIDLLNAGHDDSKVLTGPIGKEAIKAAAGFHVLKHSTDESAVARAEYYRGRYKELRTNLLVGLDKAKVAHLDSEGAKAPIDYRSLFAVQW